ncbi:type II toxin-antitoxin system HicB family antitoxin [Planctomyces sp. SH-PL62]|uniref:type II toxin-antitoxin system HicB family antitoxin n=1 Tax=Planctomyces sp. SH-PL62 TaxID=1636152 RepID=UPI00078DBB69|nr:type II toxin-antitoxin system HicB family antitoxin [Planctomyces sp. SH-PL62]AMV40708.1 HicB family protein [Planctomyces sp. SH-PL62]
MRYKGYTGVVELDEGQGVLFGRVAGLRDVITFQGASVAEAVRAFHESVDDYLDFCASRGEPPQKAYSGRLVVRIDPRLHGELAVRAEASRMSLNALIEKSLETAVRPPAAESPPPPAVKSRPRTKRATR